MSDVTKIRPRRLKPGAKHKWTPEQSERSHRRYVEQNATPEGWARNRSLRPGKTKSGQRKIQASAAELLDLLQRQDFKCAVTGHPLILGLPIHHPLQPTIDHIIPLAEGGARTIENLRVVIWAFNAARGMTSHFDDVVLALFAGAPVHLKIDELVAVSTPV